MATRKRQSLVAVIDDDASMRQALASLLGSAGIHSLGYASAELFLRSRRARSAACLIVDMQLPGMNGLALCHELHASGMDTPVVLVTADHDRSGKLRSAAHAAGVIAVFYKPFEPDALLSSVQKALASARKR
jgi:FixJ family two-component response regulator